MAGLMVPQILAIVHASFPADERGKALGFFGGVMGSAAVLGLILGGVLVQWNLFGLEWRPIFLVNLPIGIGALIAAWFVVPDSRSPAATTRLGLTGVVLGTAAIVLLVYPLTTGRSLGWPAWSFALMAGGLALLRVVVGYEAWHARAVGSPLLVLSLFRIRAFSSGLAAWAIYWVALGGFFFVWTLYMQVGGLRANAHNFVGSFSYTLWYGVATIITVFLGIFGLPERLRENAPPGTPTG